MKGTLKQIRSKAVVAFLCALVVFANVIPVSAARHDCMPIEKEGTRRELSFRQGDEDTHTVMYYAEFKCQNQTCNREMGNKEWEEAQSHSWGTYRNLGHIGVNDHMFELICQKCNGTKTIRLITCQGNITGHHVTPW